MEFAHRITGTIFIYLTNPKRHTRLYRAIYNITFLPPPLSPSYCPPALFSTWSSSSSLSFVRQNKCNYFPPRVCLFLFLRRTPFATPAPFWRPPKSLQKIYNLNYTHFLSSSLVVRYFSSVFFFLSTIDSTGLSQQFSPDVTS